MTAFTYLDAPAAESQLAQLAAQFYALHHPAGHFPAVEYLPLCPKQSRLDRGLRAVFMDMDGTTTTTEFISNHAMGIALTNVSCPGQDAQAVALSEEDVAHMIGHNLTTNLRYIHRHYAARVDPALAFEHYLDAALWLQHHAINPAHRSSLPDDLDALGLGTIASELLALAPGSLPQHLPRFRAQTAGALNVADPEVWNRVGAALYYRQYHALLRRIDAGEGQQLARELFGTPQISAVLPLPGVGYWQALVKGVLTPESAQQCVEWFVKDSAPVVAHTAPLARLAKLFQARPAKIALVTSSLRAEADIVLREIFRVLRSEIELAPWPDAIQSALLACYRDPAEHYDAIITANDAHEHRLKPHRDLYAIALSRVGMAHEDLDRVLGLEDTEAGVVALRAAGIGMACALPYEGTITQNFAAAAAVCYRGLPEVLLEKHCFIPEANWPA
ncbi:MAG: hypothetical protein HYV27_08430 [Candidatus Hydrogenedentes bacterium]|nr:hypothetical protein [Candidatus Hydrogenedentota bacterium]